MRKPDSDLSAPGDTDSLRGRNQSLGRRGEALAVHFLRDQGYEIVDLNWRSGHSGELDIIARDAQTLAFIEVKTRAGDRYGTPFDAIDDRKMRRIRALIGQWLARHESWSGHVRIDAIGVLISAGRLHIEHRRGVQ